MKKLPTKILNIVLQNFANRIWQWNEKVSTFHLSTICNLITIKIDILNAR